MARRMPISKLRDRGSFRRTAGQKPPRSITLIVCEGETEQEYFEAARLKYGLTTAEIVLAENTKGAAPISVVACAEEKCAERGGYDQIYCVFDRDGHESFDRARARIATLAGRKNKPLPVRDAISIPCFEFWVLLHHERTDEEKTHRSRAAAGGDQHRQCAREVHPPRPPEHLHLWWARRPLAAARAVIFAQMVDDPSAHPDIFPTEKKQEKERQRLFRIIEDLVKWENTTNETVLQQARDEIWQSWRYTCAENADHPRAKELFDRYRLPGFHDPFAGGGALPLEAQRLGLESYASDLNPVAVLINKAMIEIPPKFAGKPPVNPDAQKNRRPGRAGKARRASPRTCATTASGCATRPRSASATSTPRSRSRQRW
jgi:hypothetical protein